MPVRRYCLSPLAVRRISEGDKWDGDGHFIGAQRFQHTVAVQLPHGYVAERPITIAHEEVLVAANRR
jgi:hypothetical protein